MAQPDPVLKKVEIQTDRYSTMWEIGTDKVKALRIIPELKHVIVEFEDGNISTYTGYTFYAEWQKPKIDVVKTPAIIVPGR